MRSALFYTAGPMDIGLQTFVDNLLRSIRFADLVDVALVAAFLYAFIMWIRRSTARGTAGRLAAVALLFAAVYLPARFFELYLVERVAEVFFIALLLAVIVVFQEDLRRMFDRAGAWLFSGRSASAVPGTSPVDVLAEAIANMAEERTGALIAIRGQESWEHHLQGGLELHGTASVPLLYSIFDEATPGHDGALLLEGSRISRFAVHLPLAMHHPEISAYGGTRHAAALGLAEVCDAFVIVVSEERGTISVAQNGTIMTLDSAAALKEHLAAFWQEHYGTFASGGRGRWWGWKSLRTALLAVTLSVVLWLFFAYSPGSVQRSFEIPVAYQNIPAGWTLTESAVKQVEVTLSGSEQAFRLLQPGELGVTLDLSDPERGWNEFVVNEETLGLPAQITLAQADPRSVRVQAQPTRAVTLPVVIPTEGQMSDTLRLEAVRAEPDSITVLVPRQRVGQYDNVPTQPVVLTSITSSTTFTQPLALPEEARLPTDTAPKVTVHVEVSDGGS